MRDGLDELLAEEFGGEPAEYARVAEDLDVEPPWEADVTVPEREDDE